MAGTEKELGKYLFFITDFCFLQPNSLRAVKYERMEDGRCAPKCLYLLSQSLRICKKAGHDDPSRARRQRRGSPRLADQPVEFIGKL